ncbi:hypothetical protein [Telmatocola sphagniphila]|nr:hypothetical protein [Telmatocola sphagniphila]
MSVVRVQEQERERERGAVAPELGVSELALVAAARGRVQAV